MLLQLLQENEVQYCLDNWGTKEDGAKTQPRNDGEKLKQNTESPDMTKEVRQLITTKLYNNIYVDSVICPNKISVNFYNEYKKDGFYKINYSIFFDFFCSTLRNKPFKKQAILNRVYFCDMKKV